MLPQLPPWLMHGRLAASFAKRFAKAVPPRAGGLHRRNRDGKDRAKMFMRCLCRGFQILAAEPGYIWQNVYGIFIRRQKRRKQQVVDSVALAFFQSR
jgi:hypothetical protein